MASRPTITVGTRGSPLAMRQTELVVASLRAQDPEAQIEIKQIKTQGDRDQRASLTNIGGQGVFVKELEAAILAGDIDVAVHSLKDVPSEIAPGLTLAAYPERADPRDTLVSRDGKTLAELPAGARIGTGSRRRAVQLLALRSDIEPVDIRGNVDTRIRKVDEGEYHAAVLAQAGLERLGLAERASQVFDAEELLPSVGQGALVIEARAGDAALLELLASISHDATRLACETERAFMARLGGGCQLPFGAYAEIEGDSLRFRGFVADDEGHRLLRGELRVPIEEAGSVGTRLAERLLNEGAAEFMVAAEAS
ncbi:MAG: hydroxymethylbilane synthase [Chloroflexi bacterium]|nr:hydroxymethylbilane synthase [Chloroflexota bacterium]